MANTSPQPLPSDISSVCEITGIGRTDAIILLKKWPNWQDAVSHYFDDPVRSLKEEAPSRQWESADTLPYANDTGMSRPPSRTDHFQGNYYDLSEVHAQAVPKTRSDSEFEDDEMKRAMAASMEDMPGQESGVVPSGQHFGPANRPYYNPAQWSVAPPVASSREVFDHPPPAKRRRLDGQPAFLRGSPETGYVAPLLNIYYSIPLAREAFLFPQLQVYSYGHDPAWWSGSTDENSKALSVELAQAEDRDRRNLICELQCLMAFLDETDRAYGSVDALTDLRAFKNFRSQSEFSRLLESWKFAAMQERPDEQLTQVFTSSAIKDEGFQLQPTEKHLVCLESPVDRRESQTFTEILDKVVWNDTPDMALDDVWLEHVGEIFTMHLYDPGQNPGGLGTEIAEIWYPDRYMDHMRDLTRQLRQEKMRLFQEIFRLWRLQQSIVDMPTPYARRNDVRRLLELAAKFADTAADTLVPDENGFDPRSDAQIDASQLTADLSSLSSRISDKWDEIQETRGKLHAETRRVTSQLTGPSSETSQDFNHKYVLQGVSTKPNITYVRHQSRTLIELDSEDEGSAVDGWQWWRISWNESTEPVPPPLVGPQPQSSDGVHHLNSDELDVGAAYSVQKVTVDQVCEAARMEYNEVVLVYVNANAMRREPRSISAALRQFVDQDNESFKEETYENRAAERTGRGRSWSEDTNDTINNHEMLDNQLEGERQMREMTPMSMSTIRDSDGQPSPKRPRSSDDATPVDGRHDEPPPYQNDGEQLVPEMHEKRGNKIGFFADQLLEKYGGENEDSSHGATHPH